MVPLECTYRPRSVFSLLVLIEGVPNRVSYLIKRFCIFRRFIMSSTFMQCAIDGYVVIGIFRPEIQVRYLEEGVFSRSDCFLAYVQPGADFANRFLDHKMTKKVPVNASGPFVPEPMLPNIQSVQPGRGLLVGRSH